MEHIALADFIERVVGELSALYRPNETNRELGKHLSVAFGGQHVGGSGIVRRVAVERGNWGVEIPEVRFQGKKRGQVHLTRFNGPVPFSFPNREVKPSVAVSNAPDGWLSPIELARDLDEPVATASNVTTATVSKSAKTSTRATRRRTPEERLRRASWKGFLPMTLADYLSLLDWTGRQLRRDKRGAIPSEMQPLFARLKISGEGWFDLIQDFSRLFRRAAGRPESLATEAARRDRRWFQGIGNSRALFA